MKLKILFWILAVLSLPVGLFMTLIGSFSDGLGLYSTVFGKVICMMSTISLLVSIVCAVLGIIQLRRKNVRKAVFRVLAGLAYFVVLIACMFIDAEVGDIRMDKDVAARNEQMYGENWDAPPAIEGIPELYQEALNKFYAVVRDRRPADMLMDLGAMTMPEHYGDASLDNIGFILMDVNADGVEELLVGTTAPAEEGGTAIFCMYSDPENPFINLQTFEGEIYYLHAGEADTYVAEIGGQDAAWLLQAEEDSNLVDIIYQEGALDPANRLTLEMIPFSQYK